MKALLAKVCPRQHNPLAVQLVYVANELALKRTIDVLTHFERHDPITRVHVCLPAQVNPLQKPFGVPVPSVVNIHQSVRAQTQKYNHTTLIK